MRFREFLRFASYLLFTIFVACAVNNCARPVKTNTPQFSSQSDIKRFAYLGLRQLRMNEYARAREYFAAGLRESPANCELNFFNALSYQLQAQDGSVRLLGLAGVGYKNAIRACPNDPWPRYYYGLLALENNDYTTAQEMFQIASQLSANNAKVTIFLKEYLRVAFQLGEVQKVKMLLARLRQIDPQSVLVQKLSNAFSDLKTPRAIARKKVPVVRKSEEGFALPNDEPLLPLSATATPAASVAAPIPVTPTPMPAAPAPAATTVTAPGTPAIATGVNPSAAAAPSTTAANNPSAVTAAATPSTSSANTNASAALPPPPMPSASSSSANAMMMPPPPMPSSNAMNEMPPPMPMMSSAPIGAGGMSTPPMPGQTAGPFPIPTPTSERQVTIDGVIILSRESVQRKRGVNLLKGLTLQYGNGTTSPGLLYSNASSSTRGWGGLTPSPTNTTNASEYTLPTLPFTSQTVNTITATSATYDMNIFNNADEKNEIIARPSITVEDGQAASYFSGQDLILGIQGTNSGGQIQTFPMGVTMTLTPHITGQKSLDLSVEMGREFLIPTTGNTSFTQTAQALKEDTQTTVHLQYGQTMILSGLYDTKVENTSNKVPVLGDIPIIKYFFSHTEKQVVQTNLIMLLTPRKFVQFKTHSSLPTERELAQFYESRVDKKAGLQNVLRNLRDVELFYISEPLSKTLENQSVMREAIRDEFLNMYGLSDDMGGRRRNLANLPEPGVI